MPLLRWLTVVIASWCLLFLILDSRALLASQSGVTQGRIVVYLRSFPHHPDPIDIRLRGISAIREGGQSVPVPVRLSSLVNPELTRDRLLAAGELPPGRYVGLKLDVVEARLGAASADPAGIYPQRSSPVRVLFNLAKGQGVVVNLELDLRSSLEGESGFTPVFVAKVAARPPVDVLGLVSNPSSNTVSFFDKGTGEVVGLIPTGLKPTGIAVDSLRSRAYVAISGEDVVIVIGLSELVILESLQLRGGDQPLELALTAGGETLLVANTGSNTISWIDPRSMVEIDRVRVGDRPQSVIIGPGADRAYVLNTGSSTVSVIDIATRQQVAIIATDSEPHRAQFNRAGDALYLIHQHFQNMTIVDPVSLSVSRRVFVGPGAVGLKVNRTTDLIYLSRLHDNLVEIYEPFSLLPVESIRTGGRPSFLAIDGELNYLYVAIPELGELQGFELVGGLQRTRVDLGHDPYWVAFSNETR